MNASVHVCTDSCSYSCPTHSVIYDLVIVVYVCASSALYDMAWHGMAGAECGAFAGSRFPCSALLCSAVFFYSTHTT